MIEPWLPTYADVIAKYPGYGFPGLEIDAERFPILTERRAEIEMRFYERYAARKVNHETLARWQLRLQNRFDEVAPEMERAFRLYRDYKDRMDSDMVDGYKQTRRSVASGMNVDMSKSKTRDRNIDTPDSALNADPNYADSLRDGDSEGSNVGRSATSGAGEIQHTKTGAVIITNINASIYEYRDIDTEFVKAFENNFLNIFWS